jgi:hypothetical protein
MNGRVKTALKAASRAELLFREYGDKVQDSVRCSFVSQPFFCRFQIQYASMLLGQ